MTPPTSDTLAILIGITVSLLVIIGLLVFFSVRKRRRRAFAQQVSDQLDNDFGVKDSTHLRSFDDPVANNSEGVVWTNEADSDRI